MHILFKKKKKNAYKVGIFTNNEIRLLVEYLIQNMHTNLFVIMYLNNIRIFN